MSASVCLYLSISDYLSLSLSLSLVLSFSLSLYIYIYICVYTYMYMNIYIHIQIYLFVSRPSRVLGSLSSANGLSSEALRQAACSRNPQASSLCAGTGRVIVQLFVSLSVQVAKCNQHQRRHDIWDLMPLYLGAWTF